MRERFGQALGPAVLVAASVPVLLYGMTSHGISSADEAYYHGVAEHMVASGDWTAVVFRGAPSAFDTYLNAPLQYWLRAAAIALFGSNEATLRGPSALFAIASLLATWGLTRHLAGGRAALLAGLIQLTTYQLVYMHAGRVGVIEPFLTFFMTLAAFAFLRILETGRGILAHHLCLIALVNLKAPVVLIPVLAELACFALLPCARPHFARWLAWGVGVVPIGLAWHIGHAVGDVDEFLATVRKMASLGTGTGRSFAAGRIANAGYYASALAFGAFPYVTLYLPAVVGCLRGPTGQRPGFRVLLAYAVAVLAFFVLIGKRYHWYVIPAIPFFCVFLGAWLDSLRRERWALWTCGWAGFALATLVAVDVPFGSFDPFGVMTDFWELGPHVSAMLTLPYLYVLLLLSINFGGVLELTSRRFGERFPPVAAAGFTAILIGYSALRVCLPLVHVDHVSEPERVRREIDLRRAAGEPMETPIRVAAGQGAGWIARFYFAPEFLIAPLDRGYLLFPHDTPRREIERAVSQASAAGKKSTKR